MTLSALALALALGAVPGPSDYFALHIVDEQTGRGVPMVEVETTHNIRFYTDSAGYVAFHEPGLMNEDVWFTIRSHGYQFAKDGFGSAGKRLHTTPGGRVELKIQRINIAERLYRITGGGIYRDSVLLGKPVPTTQPVLNAQVHGQDSIQTAIYQGKLYWFWGDTNWISYPLGNFNMSGAVTPLPRDGLDPDKGIDLHYYVGEKGFARGVAPVKGEGPTWMGPIFVCEVDGKPRMMGPYNKIKPASLETYQRGLAVWNDEKEEFEKTVEWPLEHPARPSGAWLVAKSRDGVHLYFSTPFPMTRVRLEAKAIADLDQYEMFTCLREGTRVEDGQLDRDAQGRVRYSWKRKTPVLDQRQQRELVDAGKMRAEEGLIQLVDVESLKGGEKGVGLRPRPVMAHGGSVYWNAYRKRWVCVFVEIGGTTSMLGEMWYAEAPTPLGPWVECRKVATHDHQTFYNPLQHPYFARENGRIIYFEGTFCNTFSGNPYQTPRYDYNQMMYRLDLSDARLHLDETGRVADNAANRSRPTATRPAMEPELRREWQMEQIAP